MPCFIDKGDGGVLKLYYIYVFANVCGGHRTTWGTWFCPSTTWLFGMSLRAGQRCLHSAHYLASPMGDIVATAGKQTAGEFCCLFVHLRVRALLGEGKGSFHFHPSLPLPFCFEQTNLGTPCASTFCPSSPNTDREKGSTKRGGHGFYRSDK